MRLLSVHSKALCSRCTMAIARWYIITVSCAVSPYVLLPRACGRVSVAHCRRLSAAFRHGMPFSVLTPTTSCPDLAAHRGPPSPPARRRVRARVVDRTRGIGSGATGQVCEVRSPRRCGGVSSASALFRLRGTQAHGPIESGRWQCACGQAARPQSSREAPFVQF